MIEFIKLYIPASHKRTRPGTKMTPTSITIHETDNQNVRANARAHALLQVNGNPRQASWHLQVDDEKEVYQSLPFTEAAYHSGTYLGNHSSIALEICVNQDGNYKQALLNALEVVKVLKKQYPSIKRVVQHHHWSRKNCPRLLRANKVMTWDHFIKLTTSNPSKTSSPAKAFKPTPSFTKGARVHLKASATHYATGEQIPNRYKNKAYTVMQTSSNRVLLKELYSWVKLSDIKRINENDYQIGDKVLINESAKKYARSTKSIPTRYKNKRYTIQQVGQKDVLIKELYSWVNKIDVRR